MLDMLLNITKAAVNVAVTPAAIIADFFTMGGVTTDHEGTYTGERLRDAKDCLDKALKP